MECGNRTLAFGADGENALEVLWEDSERVFCRGQRLCADGQWNVVLAVLPAGEHPLPSSLDRLAHEYELKDELDGAWAVRPLEFVRDGGRTMLVLEDPGGEPLDRLIGEPMEVGNFLRLAISIAAALGKVHQRGLIHKDIKPANMLVNRADGQVRLTGFGIASRLSRERQSPEPPETIAGTLAYMAPEQTGRMNRSIDARSDLYALGVTFYQMLTGVLPFTAADPMEWVHCHVARRPMAPAERVDNVPVAVSQIILKLLAKTAEERYQTTAGLERDLRRCLAKWEAQQRIDAFPLGAQDTPDRLLIPEKLYGREHDVTALLAAFERVVTSGAPELVLVSGYSGIGKSSVINELHKVLVPPRGLFASGKFDQYKRNIPYATVAQAFQNLVRQLLGTSDAELDRWRAALREALGPNGQLMVNLVPELALIIGEHPPAPDLPPQDQQARFQLVFRRFLDVFARPEHPLALFLDDLQWLDAATLDLIEHLATHPEVRHLLLVGAYRDNEVGPAHPLARVLATIRGTGGVREIRLAPLGPCDVARLLADALRTDDQRVRPLADLVFEKTGGNPFFVMQFLSALDDEALLAFDPGPAAWTWDLPRIRAKGFTANVANLMAAKLRRLPRATRHALRQLACLGNVAATAMLTLVHGGSEDAIDAALWEAVRSGLVRRSDGAYTFLHDRIQEAAYGLIPEDKRAMTHLRIGRVLAERIPSETLGENIFDIVNQFDRGAALITTQAERERVAAFNLMAGKRARAATAYDAALQYCATGRALLGDTAWDRCYRLAFDLELNRAECEYLTGELASAEERLSALSRRAQTTVDAAAVTCSRVNLYTTLDRSDRAVAVGLDYLRRFAGQWSRHATAEDVRRNYDRLWQQLGARPIEALLDLPPMSDPDWLATMDVLTVLTTPAFFTDLNLFRLVVSWMATLSLEYGNSDGSCLAYAWLGGVLGMYFGEYQAGFRFGKLALDLVEKRGLDRFRARVYLVFAVHVAHWTQPLQMSRAFLRLAFEAAQDAGDLSFAAYSCLDLIANRIATGDPLDDVEREAEHGLAFARKVKFGLASDCITGQLRLIRMLRGMTPDLTSFNDADFDERRFEHHLENNPQLAIGASYYWIRKLQASIYAHDEASAIAAMSKAAPLLWTTPTQFELAEYHFYGALARAAHYDLTSAEERSHHWEALAAHHKQLAVWAEHCPENFENRAALVGAEIARIEGRELDAERLYERAIRSARANGFVHNEALANELAARFYAARAFETISHAYLRNARYCYLRWGADGKVRQLDHLHPHLREEERAPAPTSTIGTPVEHLDLATVIKVSQAVSGEIVLDKLLDTLMRTAIQQAGAARGLLILLRGAGPQIAAEATTSGDAVMVHLRNETVSPAVLPESVLRYVLRTQESVILDDAADQNPFSADPYIQRHHARSILGLPLLNHGKLTGVLYLENNLAPRVFAPARVAVLKLLASEAGISLENSRLYRDLAEREAKIRHLVDANIVGVLISGRDGPILEANDAFLDMLGYSRGDLTAGRLRWPELTPAEWQAVSRKAVDQIRAAGRCDLFEKEYFRKDGSRVPVLVAAAGIGNPLSETVAFVLDLTERKRAEEAARRSEEELRQAIETIPAMVWIASPDGDVEFINRRWQEFTGLTLDESLGWNWTEAPFHPDDVEQYMAKWNRSLATGQPFEAEMRIRRATDGEYRWLHESAVPLRDEHGNILKWYGTVTDIEDRKRAEEALQKAQAELAHVARVTTMEALTSSIAHEVNQPLGAMVTNANAGLRWLAGQPPNIDEARETLGRIIRDGHRAGEVIGQMRAFLKKTATVRARVDLTELIHDVVALVQGELRRHRILLRTELAEDLPPVAGDRVQLQQVILNLMMNGIDAMKEVADRPRELLIRSHPHASGAVLVGVQDTGVGLDPQSVERVFETFYTTKAEGMGMGLAICRSIIEAHGGRLWAAANEPRGAVFQFTLPLEQDKRVQAGPASPMPIA